MPTADDYTLDELISVCIARQINDGEIVVQGLATPLVVAGYILAKLTHAPNMQFASAIGQSVVHAWAPLAVANIEALWLDKSLAHFGFATVAAELLPFLTPKEFFRPAQVDPWGNFNNIALGKDYRKPRMRLPGVGGIPDVTANSPNNYLYVTRHSRVTFVEQLDFVSGLGHNAPTRTRGTGPRYLVSDFGQFDWANGRMRMTSIHPGVELKRVIAKTGFVLEFVDDLPETAPPTVEDVRLLREAIDPLGVRKLELLGGAARRDLLRDILAKEGAL